MVRTTIVIVLVLLCSTLYAGQRTASGAAPEDNLLTGSFSWAASQAVLYPQEVDGEKWISVKDPSVVRYRGRWHLFCTVRGVERSHAVVYLTFKKWSEAKTAEQQVLKCHPGYFCAPQVFYFRPHRKWYMLCQASDESWDPKYGPAFSSTADIASPDSWSKLTRLYENKPANIKGWLDFWVICDDSKAHLFFTSLNGKMWRAETSLERFPRGLVARAGYWRVVLRHSSGQAAKDNYEKALGDLEEAREIAERGGMKLWLADYHLEAARLAREASVERSAGSVEEGGESWEERGKRHYGQAKRLIEECGYHRRDGEVRELISDSFGRAQDRY